MSKRSCLSLAVRCSIFSVVSLVLFSSASAQSFAGQVAILDSATVTKLCISVGAKPNQRNVDSLASQLDLSVSNSNAQIETALSQLFADQKTRKLILIALTHYTIPNFDFALSKFPYTVDQLSNREAQLWIKAVGVSGGNRCFDTISRVAIQVSKRPGYIAASDRAHLFLTLSQLNYVNACKQAFMFYLVRGDGELEFLPKAENPLISLIEHLPQKRSSLPEILDFLNFYVPYRTSMFNMDDSVDHETRLRQIADNMNSHPRLRETITSVVRIVSQQNTPYAYEFVNSLTGISFYNTLRTTYLPEITYLKRYPKLPYLGGILRKFGTKNLQSIDVDIKATVNRMSFGILTLYALDTLTGVDLDQLIGYFQSDYPNLKKDPNISSIDYAAILCIEAVRRSLVKKYHNVPNLELLAASIVKKELDVMTLGLYAIAKKREISRVTDTLLLAGYDVELAKLSTLPLSDREIKTIFKDALLPVDQAGLSKTEAAGVIASATKMLRPHMEDSFASVQYALSAAQLDKINRSARMNLATSCTSPIDAILIGRKISLAQGIYEETVRLVCEGGASSEVKWYGLIPQKYLLAILRFPRILDLANMSLAKEEWKNSIWRNYNFKSESEVVLMTPSRSLPILYYQIRNKSIPLEYCIDQIRIANSYHFNYQPLYTVDIDYFGKEKAASVSSRAVDEIKQSSLVPFVPLRPNSTVKFKPWYDRLDQGIKFFLDKGFPAFVNGFYGNYFCERTTEFDSIRNWLTLPVNYLACYRATEQAFGPIRKYIDDNQADYVGDVPVLSWLAPKIFGNYNKAKGKNLQACDDNIFTARASQDYMSDWDILNIPIDPSMNVILRQTIVDSTFSKFLATYQLNLSNGQVKFVTVEGRFDNMPSDIKNYILNNKALVQIANLDLTCSTQSAANYFAHVYETFTNDTYGQFSTEVLLKFSGYLWAEPIARPNTPFYLIFNTPAGRILGTELQTYLRFWDIGRNGSNVYNNTPTDDFLNCLKGIQTSVNATIATDAQKLANDKINMIQKQFDDQKVYSFSFTTGGGGKSFSVNYANGNINLGLGVFSNGSGQVIGFGSVGGVPIFNIDLSSQNSFGAGQNNSYAITGTQIQFGAGEGLRTMTPAREQFNRSINPPTTSPSYWKRSSDGSLVYSGPVVDLSHPVVLQPDTSISGPYLVQQDMLLKDDLNGVEILKLLAYVDKDLAPQQRKIYLDALANKTFSLKQWNELVTLRNARYEKTMIEDGTWAETETVESLVPDKRYAFDIERIDAYLSDANKQESDQFFAKVEAAKKELNQPDVLPKQVRWKILYDKNYDYIRIERYFTLANGDVDKLGNTQRMPFFISKEQLKSDPTGHFYEKIMKSLTDQKFPNGDPKGLNLTAGEKVAIDKILRQRLKPTSIEEKYMNQATKDYVENQTLRDTLEHIRQEYFNTLKTWLSDPANQGDFVPAPLAVSPLAYPFLSLYPYSDDNLFYLESLKERFIHSQKSTKFFIMVEKGQLPLL